MTHTLPACFHTMSWVIPMPDVQEQKTGQEHCSHSSHQSHHLMQCQVQASLTNGLLRTNYLVQSIPYCAGPYLIVSIAGCLYNLQPLHVVCGCEILITKEVCLSSTEMPGTVTEAFCFFTGCSFAEAQSKDLAIQGNEFFFYFLSLD